MNTKNILIVSGNQLAATDLNRWEGFKATLVSTDEAAIEMVNRQSFDMAVIDHTSAEINIKKLSAVLPLLREEMELVSYEGESLGALKNRIAAVFTRQKNERIRRYLVLDATEMNLDHPVFPFSAN